MAQIEITKRTYYGVFIWLLILLAITIVLAFFSLGMGGTIIGYSVAVLKAVLIMLYFMHVRKASNLTAAFASAAFLWLGILMVLTMSDYLTRGWEPSAEVISPQIQPAIPPPD